MTPATLREAAALIESLTAERDGLALQVVQMREALEAREAQIQHLHRHSGRAGSEDYDALEVSAAWFRLNEPLRLPDPADAEAQAKANAEKAALLDSIESHGWTIEHRAQLAGHLRWLVRQAAEHIGVGLTLADALRSAREASDGK